MKHIKIWEKYNSEEETFFEIELDDFDNVVSYGDDISDSFNKNEKDTISSFLANFIDTNQVHGYEYVPNSDVVDSELIISILFRADKISAYKFKDEWFYVRYHFYNKNINSNIFTYYRCDQIRGLIDLMSKILYGD